MKDIDFSCKHDILIRNKDGSLSPMDEPYFESKEIAPGTWQILSAGDYSYLLAGDTEAILIDSGYGAGNIRKYCESVCGLPVRKIANTHEHFDHTANNGYFDLVYLSEKARPNATVPYASFSGIDFPRDYPVCIVKAGDIIDIPGRSLQVFEIADHTPGGLAFLDRRERILFSGDEIWPRKKLNTPVESYAGYLREINKYQSEFDSIYAGDGYHDASIIEKHLASAARILAGEQGTPLELPPRKPHHDEFEGHVVYDRMMPHPGDNAGNLWGREPRPTKTFLMETEDTALMYSIDVDEA